MMFSYIIYMLMANFFQCYGCQILTQFTHERNSVRRMIFLLKFIFELKTRLYAIFMTQKPKKLIKYTCTLYLDFSNVVYCMR